MRIGIRVDASLLIGTGHLRRCMSLASALVEYGAEVVFVVRLHDNVGEVVLGTHEFPVVWLEPSAMPSSKMPSLGGALHEHWAAIDWIDDATQTIESLIDFQPDWIIVDHYSFDARWHNELRRGLGCRLMAIDDLADRPLSVDVLLDANFAQDHTEKYAGRLDPKTRILGGPRFALLSNDYRSAEPYVFNEEVRSIGVFMGGTDPGAVSARVLKTCREDAGFMGYLEVVTTSANPQLDALARACAASPNTKLSVDLPNLSAFYAGHDLQIGAGGTATYERCCMGAPSIAIAVAANQLAVIPVLASRGTLREAWLPTGAVSDDHEAAPHLAAVVRDLVVDRAARLHLSEQGKVMVDGFGAIRTAIFLLGRR